MFHLRIESERLLLYPIRFEDRRDLLSIYNDPFYRHATGAMQYMGLSGLRKYICDDRPESFFLAARDRQSYIFVGCVKGFVRDDVLWISMLAVQRDRQDQGYGSEMFHSVLEAVQNIKKVTKILISVKKENQPGITFWRSLAFNEITSATTAAYLYAQKPRTLFMGKNI